MNDIKKIITDSAKKVLEIESIEINNAQKFIDGHILKTMVSVG